MRLQTTSPLLPSLHWKREENNNPIENTFLVLSYDLLNGDKWVCYISGILYGNQHSYKEVTSSSLRYVIPFDTVLGDSC